MLVRVVKEFDLKSNGVSLVGSNPAVSDCFCVREFTVAEKCYIPILSYDIPALVR